MCPQQSRTCISGNRTSNCSETIQASTEHHVSVTTPDWTLFRKLLIGFPTRPDVWRQNGIPAQKALLKFVAELLRNTKEDIVIISSPDLSLQSRELLTRFMYEHDKERLSLATLPMDDCWLRDTGPIFTTTANGVDNITGMCFRFNAWGGVKGGCYHDFEKDALLNKRLCSSFDIPVQIVDVVLEGGSISTDGNGTLITTEECLLNQNRNANLSKPEIESVLRRYLGARKVIWLPYGSAFDDDTDGHVDNIAVFARPRHVILAYGGCEQQRKRSRAAAKVLECEHDADGNRIIVHKVPVPVLHRSNEEANGVLQVPGVMKRSTGRICASYVNFLICGDCVFVPGFGVGEDVQAAAVFGNVFEGKKIVMVDAKEFVLAGGGLHCLTVGIPR